MEARTARDLTVRVHALVQAKRTELAASSLRVPIAYYRDRALFEWERDELLRRTPLVAAPSAQVPRPGDYHVRELLGTSVLITRDGDGRAHVLQNYCSHRGARVADGSGSAARFVCRYHHWTYGCDGALLGRPRAACFDDLPDGERGLLALPAEERHGLIWCVLAPEARIDVATHLGTLAAELEAWGYGGCTYLDHREIQLPANWKAGLENFADFYHVPYVHQSSEAAHVGDCAAFDRFGRHHRLLSGMGSLTQLSAEEAARVRDDAHLVVAYWVYPNLVLTHQAATIDLVQFLPGAAPGACTMRHTCLARRPSLGVVEREHYRAVFEAITAVFTGEDAAALERAGDGLAHSAREHLLIGRNEPGVQNIVRTLQAAGRGRAARSGTGSGT